MYLVHERKKKPGTWEVAWTWLPQFLGADPALVRYVDKELSAAVADLDRLHTNPATWPVILHDRAIEVITSRYPIKGLWEYLRAICAVNPEEKS